MRKKRRKQCISSVKIFLVVSLLLLGVGFLIHLGDSNREESENELKYSSRHERDTIRQIVANSKEYPKELVELLENNPEIAEFVANYPSADKSKIGKISQEERRKAHPLLLQWDKRWGYADYGESMIAISGCGPACLSMAVLGLTHQPVSPYDVAKFSEDHGYYVKGSGTSWTLMTEGADYYGLHSEEISLSEAAMQSALDSGGMIICAMGPGDFTSEGHYILIYGYEKGEFLVNDPNSRERSGKKWLYSKLSGQIRNLWALYEG